MHAEAANQDLPEATRGVIGARMIRHAACTLHDLFAGQLAERVEPGAAIFWQGDHAAHVFEIASGAMRTVRVLNDGRRVITGFLFAGDIIGATYRDRYLTTVEAIVPTRIRRLSHRRFEDDVEKAAALRPALVAHLRDEMTASQDQIVLLARKSAEERVASFLLSLARRKGADEVADTAISLPMTRQDMADYLGLTIETVSRIMTRLTRQGIIAPSGRHEVEIRRPATLAALAVDDMDEKDEAA